MTGHDDLTPWDDDPLVRALRAPGTADELAGEAEFLAAFRAAQPAAGTAEPGGPTGRGRLRLVGRRLGGGGTAVVVAVALGAGAAAAAYTQNLPDPVQRAVHGVLGPVGVPAPEKPRTDPTPGADGSPDAPRTSGREPGSVPPQSPTEEPSEVPSESPTESPTDSPTESPTDAPTAVPTPSPTDSPTSTPTPVVPSALSVTAASHRGAPDEMVAFSGTVSAADGAAVADQPVSLLRREGRTWASVATGTSDASGAVSIAAPALTRTSVFRLGAGDAVASDPWRVVLVPTLTLTSRPDGSSAEVVVTARGGRAGDRIELLGPRAGGPVVVGRTRLGTDLTATFRVAGPSTRARYVARLPRTRAHAAARGSVRLAPVTPAALDASVADTTPGPRDTVVVTGTVRSAEGAVLPGRQVWLVLRERGGDWQRVGGATSDASGSVSISAGPLDRSAAVRLRVGTLRSTVVRLQLQPEWTTTVTPGEGSAVVGGRALGGASGDRVLLRTLVDGVLTTIGESALASDGSVRFQVPLPDRRQVRYRLVLLRTPLHLRATTVVAVPPASR